MIQEECDEVGEHTLKRALGPTNLIALGIGAIIGTGIFVLTGSVAALNSGPAVVLSFTFAGIACAFAGLCYSEFASLIPIAGSAYTYGYATLGELIAWIIGWDLILEYAFGAATVASGWSANVVQLLARLGVTLPPQWIATPGTHLAYYRQMWQPVASLPAGVDATSASQRDGGLQCSSVSGDCSGDHDPGHRYSGIGHYQQCHRVRQGWDGAGFHRHRGRVRVSSSSRRPKSIGRRSFHPTLAPRATLDGRASCAARAKSFSHTLASTPFPPRRRKPRIRKRTCRWAFSDR